MQSYSDKVVEIGEIPFIVAPLKTPNNFEGLPDNLHLALEVREGVISQVENEETKKVLADAYSKGSVISGQMDDFGNGKIYAEDFLNYILECSPNIEGKRVLEIGCGTGYLLSRLTREGAFCTGVEPGDSADYGVEKFGVHIIRDFFNSDTFADNEKFDYIICYDVLEHMFDIDSFLNDVKHVLAEWGGVFVGVPDCTKQILNGDISMLLSEHWSYFTRQSLKKCLNSNGLYGDVVTSTSGGNLYAYVTAKEQADDKKLCDNVNPNEELVRFEKLYQFQKKKMINFFSKCRGIGIYVPGRFVYWLSILRDIINIDFIKFIDDNEILQGTYYPGFNQRIENLDAYLLHPDERVLIASYTYERAIRERLLEKGYQGEIISIRELLESE